MGFYYNIADYGEAELAEAFGDIEEVTGSVFIVQSPSIVNLNFLRSLRQIRCALYRSYHEMFMTEG